MKTWEDLIKCKKRDDESWPEFAQRYNNLVDELNYEMIISAGKWPYSKLTVIIPEIK